MRALEPICRDLIDDNTQILGPSPAPFAKINQQFRHHIIIKAKNASRIKEVLAVIQKAVKCPKGIFMQIDVDPATLM